MIHSFADAGTRDIYNGKNTKAARKTAPQTVWSAARRRLDALNAATELRDLSANPGNRLEGLQGDREGTYSIRVNDQYRVTFAFAEGAAHNVALEDYH